MILQEFASYIQNRKNDLISGKSTALKILCDWIRLVIKKNPKGHVDKIVQTEILLAENKYGEFFITAKSESGRTLVNALYNFALSYEHYIMQKWLDDKNPQDFKK